MKAGWLKQVAKRSLVSERPLKYSSSTTWLWELLQGRLTVATVASSVIFSQTLLIKTSGGLMKILWKKKIVPVNYTLYLEWFKKIIKTIKSVSYSCWEGEVQLCEAFFASVTLSCSAPQFARSMSCCSGNKASYPLLQHCHLHHHIRPRCRARPVHKALTKCMRKLQLGYLQCKRFKLFVLPPVYTIVCIFEDEMEGRSASS